MDCPATARTAPAPPGGGATNGVQHASTTSSQHHGLCGPGARIVRPHRHRADALTLKTWKK